MSLSDSAVQSEGSEVNCVLFYYQQWDKLSVKTLLECGQNVCQISKLSLMSGQLNDKCVYVG